MAMGNILIAVANCALGPVVSIVGSSRTDRAQNTIAMPPNLARSMSSLVQYRIAPGNIVDPGCLFQHQTGSF